MNGWTHLRAAGLRLRDQHIAAFAAPHDAQSAVLQSVLTALQGSSFAADHQLRPDMGLDAYRAAVPTRTYDDFRSWMDLLLKGDGQALTGHAPVAFELTGGTSGGRKPVPVTDPMLEGFRRALMAWIGDLTETCPGIMAGSCYFALSPALRKASEPIGPWPIGLPSDLAYFGAEYGPHLARHLLFRPEIAAISDPEKWRIATLAMILANGDLSFVSVWSPTFLLALLHTLETDPDPVLKALNDGVAGLSPDPARARSLTRVALGSTRDIWPKLSLVSAWADASSAHSFAELGAALPHVRLQGKGLLATEGCFTVPFMRFRDPVPAILSGFLEFRDAAGACHQMHEIEDGEIYDLIVSPIGGFARYDIGDRVLCTGWAQPGVPMLRFVGRSGVSSDLVGEKLTEAFVLDSLRVANLHGVLAARQGSLARYDLIVNVPAPEDALLRLDAALSRNPQYAYARQMKQLGPPGQLTMPDLADRLLNYRLDAGHRLSDIKPPVLLSAEVFFGLLDP